MPMRRVVRRRRRNWAVRAPRLTPGNVTNTIHTSSLTMTAGNVGAAKNFTYAVLLNDVNAGRNIVIHEVIINAVMAGGTSFGCHLQGRLIGEPFSGAGGVTGLAYGSCSTLQAVSIGRNTIIRLRPRVPGAWNFVQPESTNTLLQVVGYSFLAGTVGLAITVKYTYGNDQVITNIA